MRWNDGNVPLFSLDELRVLVRDTIPADVKDDVIKTALAEMITLFSGWFDTVYHLTIPGMCAGQCEVQLGAVDVRKVSNVEVKGTADCGTSDMCWSSLPWFRMVGTNLQTSPLHEGDTLRIEFIEPGPVHLLGEEFTTGRPFDGESDTSFYIDLGRTSVSPQKTAASIPSAGYFTSGEGDVLEYVGRNIVQGDLVLHNVTTPEWFFGPKPQITVGTPVEFLLAVRDFSFLEVLKRIVMVRYFEEKMLVACTSDEDRSFYSQMLSFYSGERDKANRMVRGRKVTYTPRVLFRESRQEVNC